MSFYANNALSRNGDTVIKVVQSTTTGGADKAIQALGDQNFASLNSWWKQDPLKNHLKLQTMFGSQKETQSVPLFQDVLQHDAILELNGWEDKFTYDTPIETDDCIKTADDTSYQQLAGADGTTFKIVLNREFSPYTTLTADGMDGDAISVSDVEPVRDLGWGFEHTVVLMTNDPDKTYPSYLLAKDIEYFETGGGIAEYSEKLNTIHMPVGTKYMTSEFQLGTGQGVETSVTGKANSVDLRFGTTSSMEYITEIEQYYKTGKEVVFLNEVNSKTGAKVAGSKNTVASIQEMLAIQKFNNNFSVSLMFQKAATLKTQKGVMRYNEGLWHQMRRGYVITYSKRGGINKEHIKQARDYVFKANPSMNTIDSEITFECGSEAFNNILEIFKPEFLHQLSNIQALLGSERLIDNPVSGDLYNLRLKPVRVTSVNLPGIGQVNINENHQLNYVNITDKNLRGMNPNGQDYTTYSMIIWDASDKKYSNNGNLPKGTTKMGNDNGANIYMVAPKGDKIFWGRENGRYSTQTATDIVASAKTMHSSFFIYGFGAMLMIDPSKFVTIELEKSARKGYK